MTIAERHAFILKKLKEEDFVRVVDLSEALEVSTVTIRKDLKLLEEKNLLFRSHGSASALAPYVTDRHVQEKAHLQVGEKQRIAQAAAQLVQPGDALILGSGTTVEAFARELTRIPDITVLTAALNVSLTLAKASGIEVIQLGGSLRQNSFSVIGPYAEDMIANFACSKLFLGVDGLTFDHGLTTSNMMEAHLNQRMIEAAEKLIVLADASKFGKKGFGRICGLDAVDQLVTDEAITSHQRQQCEENGIELSVV
jgi:DeoR family transcriptional regulator of aga operon